MYGMRAWSCIAIVTFVAGCGPGSGEGLDANGRPIGEEGGGGELVPTFGSIQANVFTPNCAISGCHSGAAAPFGLRLDAGSSYALLVGVPSGEVPGLNRVTPGDPDASYVIHKLEGTQEVGERMPRGGPYLPQATIDVIRQWISDGAQPDPDAPDLPPTVVSVTPADGASLDAFPSEVEILFSEDMDPSLVNESSVLLTASGGDGGFDDGNETQIQPASVALDAGNPRRAIVDLTGVEAGADSYELRLTSADPVAIADLEGEALDGDGDGQSGPDFVSIFAVTGVAPTLQSLQETVFGPICSGCHTGPAGPDLPSGQDLSSAEATYANLVEVPSLEVPDLLRVNPGNADASYLVQKLEGTADVGERMPLNGDPLPAETIAAIREWIGAGAPFESDSDDTTAPTVSITAPGAGDTLAGDVTLEAAASDEVGVLSVAFLVDDERLGAADTSGPYEKVWDTTTVSDGAHTITVEATDAAGNVGRATRAVTVANDTSAPAVSITSPADGATVGGSVAVEIDADADAVRVDLLVDGDVTGSDSNAPFQILWDTTASADGAHTLVARAVDAADNEGESDPIGVTVDNSCTGDSTPPTVTLTAPPAGFVTGTVTVSADADDDVGVTQVLFFAGTALIGSAADAPYQIDWDTTTATEGAVSLTARASDACGNETTSAAVDVTIDNSALAVSAVAPADGGHEITFPASIDVTFDEAVDPTTVGVGSFVLVRSGGDGAFDNGNDVAITAPVSANGTSATMDLSGVALVADTYRVTLSDTITDLAGVPLDGDGDGEPSGDFAATFRLGVTYTLDAQPIYSEKCDPCHTTEGFGGHNIGSNYDDAFLPSGVYPECFNEGLLVGQCTIVLIQEGEMPFGAGCTGDPAQDVGDPECLTQDEQDIIQAWIDEGMPE
jgi:methionine-rich copper-binding protein CopC